MNIFLHYYHQSFITMYCFCLTNIQQQEKSYEKNKNKQRNITTLMYLGSQTGPYMK